MKWRRTWSMLLWSLMLWSCVGVGPPLDLSSLDPSQDQWRIAEYYSREAARHRQKSQELYARILIYERLFGAESEWVVGTRLLAQSYEDAAIEHERSAYMHLELARGHRAPRMNAPPPDS
jgi:hypothetical protein